MPTPPGAQQRLTQLPKASSTLLGSGEPRAHTTWLGFDFLPVPGPPHAVVFTVALVLLYLFSPDPPPALCVGSPILVLCTWAPLQGLGSQPPPPPNTGICLRPSHWGWRAEGAQRGKAPPYPQLLLLFSQGEGTQSSLPRAAGSLDPWSRRPLHQRGRERLLQSTQGCLVRYVNQVEVPTQGLGQCIFLARLVLHFFSSLADRE